MVSAGGTSTPLDVDLVFRAVADDAGPLAGLAHEPLLERLEREFPSIEVVPGSRGEPVDVERWLAGGVDLAAFDHTVETLAWRRQLILRLRGRAAAVAQAAWEVATRCQRCADRRNPMSRRPSFDAVLALHRRLHYLDLPLVRADHRHALDTWQWVLRLQPQASLALQLAALFHDVERLQNEAEVRREQQVPDYERYKRDHAQRGAEIAMQVLAQAGVALSVCRRAAALIAAHEEPGADPGAMLLAEADALSFFSLDSDGYLDYFGAAATRRKIDWTLRRLGPQGQALLPTIRLRGDVADLLGEVIELPAIVALIALQPELP